MLWSLLLACAPARKPAASPAPPGEGPVKVHMAQRLALALETRDAVVFGDLEGARAGFQKLADQDAREGLPDGSLPWLEAVLPSAREGAAATTTQDQAMALGAMANNCGGCHESLGTGPLFTELPAPEGDGLALHMAQHAWANDRMWAALVEPSSAAWTRSLRVLGPEAVPARQIEDWGLPPGSEEMDETVHTLAHAALQDDNPDTRADLYGQIIGQCGSCHQASRR